MWIMEMSVINYKIRRTAVNHTFISIVLLVCQLIDVFKECSVGPLVVPCVTVSKSRVR